MKKMIKLLYLACMMYSTGIKTATLTVTNSASEEITITLQTAKQSYTKTLMANENQMVNTLSNTVLTSTPIEYDNNPVESIIINRLSTTMPQIIENTHEVTTNSIQAPTGLYALNLNYQGVMDVVQNSVTLNNRQYNLIDLSTCITKFNNLIQNLSLQNMDFATKEIDTINGLITQIQSSDKASEVQTQVLALQTIIQNLANMITTVKNLQKNIDLMNKTTQNLTASNADQAIKDLQATQIGLKAITQTPLQGLALEQAHALQNSMNQLIGALQQLGFTQKAQAFEMLIPYEFEINRDKAQIQQMTTNSDMVQGTSLS